jgi:GNAT superfamily N-acetyltransferase
MVEPATAADIPSWLALASEVEPLFGSMPAFDVTLKGKIAEGAAFCVRDGAVPNDAVLGGVLVGGAAPDHWIRWLAVRASARRQGVGAALIEAVLAHYPPPCTISLATFGEDNPAGRPARRLYERFGFAACEMLPRGPEGGTRQKYVLTRR